MKWLVLFLALTTIDDTPPTTPPPEPIPSVPCPPSDPAPTPDPVPAPAPPPPPPPVAPTPEELARRKARQIVVDEIAFCKDWFNNLTNKQFYQKWNDGFDRLCPEGQSIFFMAQAGNLEARMRKLCWSLEEVIASARVVQNVEVFAEATKFNEEIVGLRKQLAAKRASLIQDAIDRHPSLMSGLKLQMKRLDQYNKDNEL